ncbi:MAG: LytTR family DNA-binding domain-containing protein [Bacteroidota bacterium]
MKVLIIEDEKPASDKLIMLLKSNLNALEIVGVLQSVRQSVKWFEESFQEFDLLFLDIQLADGLSFEIFKKVKINKPIIFTTAYNEYAIDAFKVNSIDYLLKPITGKALKESLDKLEVLRKNLPTANEPKKLDALQEVLATLQKNYKKRFMVKLGEHIKSVATEKIAFFYAEGRTVFLLTKQGRKFIIDYKIEELVDLLDPATFFRLNRSFIVGIHAITDVVVFSNSRLKVITDPTFTKEMIVSREKVSDFKDWFDGFG